MSEWIFCKEREPEKEGIYIITIFLSTGSPFVTAGLYRYGEWDVKDVDAWMPFPEPPKMRSGAE